MIYLSKRERIEGIMKIAKDVVIQRVADFYVAVSVGERAANSPPILRLNESGAFLWNKCVDSIEVSAPALAEALVLEYGIGEDVAKVDAEKFIKMLAEHGLLE